MFGLLVDRDGSVSCEALLALLDAQMIPFGGFVQGGAEDFPKGLGTEDFLRQCAWRLMQPGRPLPMGELYRHLTRGDALPGNVIRKYTCLQLSLLPCIRADHKVVQLEGCFLLGERLLVAPMGEDGRVDASLPAGIWTELSTGECVTGRLRRLRGLNEMPILARENALIPIGVNDRTPHANDADRVTLHWFEPRGAADCTLADGTVFRAWRDEAGLHAQSNSSLPWHMLVHSEGGEMVVEK